METGTVDEVCDLFRPPNCFSSLWDLILVILVGVTFLKTQSSVVTFSFLTDLSLLTVCLSHVSMLCEMREANQMIPCVCCGKWNRMRQKTVLCMIKFRMMEAAGGFCDAIQSAFSPGLPYRKSDLELPWIDWILLFPCLCLFHRLKILNFRRYLRKN